MKANFNKYGKICDDIKRKDPYADFRIIEKLGKGGFGAVYAGYRNSDHFPVAIKVINKSKLDPEDLESLKNEVRLMQQVDHPNIVKYYETYDDSKYIYLCMELCTGGELFEKVTKRKKPFSEGEAAEVMRDLLKALQHCHS